MTITLTENPGRVVNVGWMLRLRRTTCCPVWFRELAADGRNRALAEWMVAQASRDSNGDESAWRLKPCSSLFFVNGSGELDRKHDQDLRDTCVMLLDRAGCDLLTICDITGHSYKSAQTIVKHYRARNAPRADAGIDRLVLQVRKEGMA